MNEIKTEFEYVLLQPITYAHDGEQRQASFIKLTAPTARNSRECAYLKQAFWRSVDTDRGTGGNDPNESGEISANDVMLIISMSQTVNLADVMDVARHLFTRGKVAKVDGEVQLTTPLLDGMHHDDAEAMLGEYLVNFTLASSLAQMTKSSTKES